jgi:hypothetical protein
MMPALLLSAALAAPAARADMYDVTVSGADTGSLVITESSGNISVVTGTFDGSTVDSLLPTDSIGGNDNTFSTSAPYLDFNGVSFSLDSSDSDGFEDVDLYYNSSVPYYGTLQGNGTIEYPPGFTDYAPDALTATLVTTAAPEPGTAGLLLLGLGLLGLLAAMRKRILPASPQAR